MASDKYQVMYDRTASDMIINFLMPLTKLLPDIKSAMHVADIYHLSYKLFKFKPFGFRTGTKKFMD